MDTNEIWKKNEWVLEGSTFHTQSVVHNTENCMQKDYNFLSQASHKLKLEWTSSDRVQPALGILHISAKIYFRHVNELPSDQYVSEVI